MKIVRYRPEDIEQWNRFVAESKNATFLFDRGYMDYHSDRVRDHSLILRQNDQIIALFPVSEHGRTVVSHGGLTYGGVLSGSKMSAAAMLHILDAVVDYYRAQRYSLLRYKAIPHIYHRYPAEEDLYALFRAGAKLCRTDVTTAIPLASRRPLSKGKKHNLSKARRAGIEVSRSSDYAEFMALLEETLASRHDTQPVHGLAEIELLVSRFPENIQLWVTRAGSRMAAGTVLYITDTVVHTQYMASSAEGKECGALDAVIIRLLDHDWGHSVRYFDFGISNTDEGRVLNEGLCAQKEMFGGSSVAHMFFEIAL